jgi:hypothetical protein
MFTSYINSFNIHKFYVLPKLYLCVLYLYHNKLLFFPYITYMDLFFFNRDEECLQRGTTWLFKWKSLCFVFKG